ncbi:hypothetical protein O181_081787 [Austropuccinia psidii MF-1]|uniref:GAG-pre-integrase domain-containing protein n=1 Tax=Austropuccinia psidii MF-1 TaxID=1389203 RepID=A0A9Q3FRC7_9BASI|nr:hypothetical protein [Austropuccinia psidii MF-1]
MQEPYCAANCFSPLKSDGFNFAEWLTCLNWVLSVAFNTEMLVDGSPSSLKNQLPEENRAIFHFIDVSIPHKFALCVGITPACLTAKAFFVAIKASSCPGNRFEKLRLVRGMLTMLVKNGHGTPQPNNVRILSLCCTFVLLKKLGVEADELEGLLAQAVCHAAATLNQLVTTAILARGEEKPNLTFVVQVILNPSTKTNKDNCQLSPFVSLVAHPPATQTYLQRPCSPGPSQPWRQAAEVVVNPNLRPHRPKTPEERTSSALGSRYQCERVSQVQFMEHHAADKVWIDRGASIHLSGSEKFATDLRAIHPFCIFFADSNLSITITQIVTLRIPVKGVIIVINDVSFSNKVSGTILSMGRLCKATVFPLFSGLMLSLVVFDCLITTTFHNTCWWMNFKLGEGTIESAAETPSLSLIEMNPLSFPSTSKLSCQEWHVRLGHASNKVVRSFLKKHVPSFELKTWKSFYCKVCAKSKSTHQLATACIDVPRDKPLDLLVSDIIRPFDQDPQGFQYLLTIRNHISTFSIVYPLKLRLDAPVLSPWRSKAWHWLLSITTIFTPGEWQGQMSQPHSGGYGKGHFQERYASPILAISLWLGVLPAQPLTELTMPKFLTAPGPVRTVPLDCYIISIRGKGHCACAGGPAVTQASRKGH